MTIINDKYTPGISTTGVVTTSKLYQELYEIAQVLNASFHRSRDSGENQMETDLDMNGKEVFNLVEATEDTMPVRYKEWLERLEEAGLTAAEVQALIDASLAGIDLSDFYTKAEIDTMISGLVGDVIPSIISSALGDYYTAAEVDAAIAVASSSVFDKSDYSKLLIKQTSAAACNRLGVDILNDFHGFVWTRDAESDGSSYSGNYTVLSLNTISPHLTTKRETWSIGAFSESTALSYTYITAASTGLAENLRYAYPFAGSFGASILQATVNGTDTRAQRGLATRAGRDFTIAPTGTMQNNSVLPTDQHVGIAGAEYASDLAHYSDVSTYSALSSYVGHPGPYVYTLHNLLLGSQAYYNPADNSYSLRAIGGVHYESSSYLAWGSSQSNFADPTLGYYDAPNCNLINFTSAAGWAEFCNGGLGVNMEATLSTNELMYFSHYCEYSGTASALQAEVLAGGRYFFDNCLSTTPNKAWLPTLGVDVYETPVANQYRVVVHLGPDIITNNYTTLFAVGVQAQGPDEVGTMFSGALWGFQLSLMHPGKYCIHTKANASI